MPEKSCYNCSLAFTVCRLNKMGRRLENEVVSAMRGCPAGKRDYTFTRKLRELLPQYCGCYAYDERLKDER